MDVEELYQAITSAKAGGVDARTFAAELRDARAAQSVRENPALEAMREDLRATAARLRTSPPEALAFGLFRLFDTTGERLAFEDVYFARRLRLMAFAFSAWLYGEQEDISALEDAIWAICDEYSWALPAHMDGRSLEPPLDERRTQGVLHKRQADNTCTLDLFACETGLALTEAVYLLEDRLAPIVTARARQEVHRRVLEPFLRGGAQKWEMMRNNWCAVCAGSIGAAAMYLIDDTDLLCGLLSRLMPALSRFIGSFEEDGACMEGLSYWTYGMGFYTVFADLLRRRTAGKIDLMQGEKFQKIALFQQKCYFPGGRTLSFSDGDSADTFRPGLTCLLCGRVPGMQAPPQARMMPFNGDRCARFSPTLRDLIWTQERFMRPARPSPVEVLPAAQWMICRSGDTAFAAKGGHNDEPHNHNDIGSFVYCRGGEILLSDLGAGEYTKDYFGAGRYGIFCNRSSGHSVPIVAGQEQRPGRTHCAREWACTGTEMTLDISRAYDVPALKKLRRTLRFNPADGSVTITDCIAFDGAALPVTERFISLIKPYASDTGARIKASGVQCGIVCVSALGVGGDIPQAQVSCHRHQDHAGREAPVYSIDYALVPKGSECTVTFRITGE